jgi:hypothetical protein
MQELRSKIRNALTAATDLRAQLLADMAGHDALSTADRDTLCGELEQLIAHRIEVLNAFEFLVRLAPKRAADMLLRLYLGRGVSPDTKFGGYEFELSTMVDDLVELAGEAALTSLVKSDRFDPDKLEDPRVQRCFSEALSCEPEDVLQWYRVRVEAS